MKITSVWSLERDDCQVFNTVSRPEGRYTLSFTCGLVVSSRFFSRLSLKLKQRAVIVHGSHHGGTHGAKGPYGLMSYVYNNDPPILKRVQCGVGCNLYREQEWVKILDRSDITDEPLAKIKEGGQIFELRLTMANQLLCSCTPGKRASSGQVCSHVIKLLTGNSSGVTWDKGQKDTASRVVKRRMLFDE